MNGNRPQRASLGIALALVAAGSTALFGCGKVLGFEDFSDGRGSGDAPDATTDAPVQLPDTGAPDAVSHADGGDGGGQSDGGGGDGGDGGDGGGCTPNATAPCSENAQGQSIPGLPTPAQGVCKLGTKTCGSNGTWGACTGAVGPAARDCNSANDNDCDGLPDSTIDAVCECNTAHPTRTITGGAGNCQCTETCGATNKWVVCAPPAACDCTPAETRTCIGASGCAGGTQTCAAGRVWGTCAGAPAKATYCQDHDGDTFCAAAVACTTVCPGQLAAEWKTGCATTDCDDTKATVTPNAPPTCAPTNVCKTGTLACAAAGNTCVEKGNVAGGTCGTNSTCGGGTCNVCPAGSAICSGTCINVSGTDANNCGGCGVSCGGTACSAGRCLPKTVTTATEPILSLAVLSGIPFYSTATGIYHCIDAACSSAAGLSAPNAVLKARNNVVFGLTPSNIFRYSSAGTIVSQGALAGTHSFDVMDVTPNGTLYAIDRYDLIRFDTTNLSAGVNLVTVISGDTDQSVQLFSVAADNDVFVTMDGLGQITKRCLGTTCSDVAQDSDYVHVVNQHLAYVGVNTPAPVNYCSYDLLTCSQIATGVTSYVADDGQVIYVNLNNNLVSIAPLNANKQTVILAGYSSYIPSNIAARQIAFDGVYIYWVGVDGKSVQRVHR